MKFECPICHGWNTYTKNTYNEGEKGVCFDCMKFFRMNKREISWILVRNWIILVIFSLAILYLLGWFR